MGTTIDGVYKGGKRERRVRALARLEKDLTIYEKELSEVLENVGKGHLITNKYEKQITRIQSEIKTLKSRI